MTGWVARLDRRRLSGLSMFDQVAYDRSRTAVLSLLSPKQASALRLNLDGHDRLEIARRLHIT